MQPQNLYYSHSDLSYELITPYAVRMRQSFLQKYSEQCNATSIFDISNNNINNMTNTTIQPHVLIHHDTTTMNAALNDMASTTNNSLPLSEMISDNNNNNNDNNNNFLLPPLLPPPSSLAPYMGYEFFTHDDIIDSINNALEVDHRQYYRKLARSRGFIPDAEKKPSKYYNNDPFSNGYSVDGCRPGYEHLGGYYVPALMNHHSHHNNNS